MVDLGTVRVALGELLTNREQSPALARALGMTPVAHPVNLAAGPTQLAEALAGRVGGLYRVGETQLGAVQTGLYVAFVDQWHDRSADREPYRRRVAKALVEYQKVDARWLCVLMDHAGMATDAEFVLPRRREGASPGTVRSLVSLKHPSRFHLELLAGLDTSAARDARGLSQHWNEAFSVERVTSQFHREFRELRDQVVEALLRDNATNPAIAGRDRKKEKAFELQLLAFGTRQLGRLLFLWFLQQKRWLGDAPGNGSTTYLLDLFGHHAGGGDDFFNDVLVPIFFDGLGRQVTRNNADPRRRAVTDRFGPLPGPGGSLFRAGADAFEEALFGLDGNDERTIRVSLPDDLFDPAKDRADGKGARTVLGLLSGYRFTTQESTPDDQSVDPDPELLGKVFENLYQEDDRKETGAFYTPREVVHYMCREALDGYLREQTGIAQEQLDWVRQEAIDWEVSAERLDATLTEALHHALDRVTVLDPAAGSGAFLVGAMQEIVLLRRGLVQAETDHDIDRASLEIAEWKRRAITASLYGVDINPMAIEICRLRLWLSLIIDQEVTSHAEVVSLPDLDFRIVAGDSLVDRMGKEPFIQSLPDPQVAGYQPDMQILQKVNRLQHEIDGLKLKFQGEGAPTPAQKREYVHRIRRAQLQVATVQLDHALYWARETVEARQKNPRTRPGALREAREHVAALERLQAGLQEDAAFQKPFLWPVNFHEVFERGGFDIVLANPPYVRQESLDAIDQESYSHAFTGVHAGTADLLVYFYERALQVLREGGQLAFITSNKFFKADYGAGIRATLARELELGTVIDFGHIPVFKADVMAAVVTGRKCRPAEDHRFFFARLREPLRVAIVQAGARVNVHAVREELSNLPVHLLRHGRDAVQGGLRTAGWGFVSPVLSALGARLCSEGVTFGRMANTSASTYGIKTGLNEAFVLERGLSQSLMDEDPQTTRLLHRWTRGQDVRRWRIDESGLSFLGIQCSTDADASNPWAAARDEGEARRIFRDAYPAAHAHLSAFESGLRPRADQGKWWWELRACVYYAELRKAKMVWKDIGYTPHFAWDTSGSYLANTCFFSSSAPKWLVAVCNSECFEWLAAPRPVRGQGRLPSLAPERPRGRASAERGPGGRGAAGGAGGCSN